MAGRWRVWACAACLAAPVAGADDPPAGGGEFPAEAAAEGKEPAWAKSWDAALADAKQSGKLVMADFYTNWCVPCKKLERETYRDPKVAAVLAKDFVVVKIDCDSPAGEPLAEKHKVEAYPTVLFLDGDGKVVHRHVGFAEAEPFLEKLAGMADVKNLPQLLKDSRKRPSDGELAARAVSALCLADDLEQAKAIAQEAGKAGSNGPGLAKAYNKIGDVHQEKTEFDDAIGWFDKAVKADGGREKAYGLLSIGSCKLAQDKLAEAETAIRAGLAVKDLPKNLKADGEKLLRAARGEDAGEKAKEPEKGGKDKP